MEKIPLLISNKNTELFRINENGDFILKGKLIAKDAETANHIMDYFMGKNYQVTPMTTSTEQLREELRKDFWGRFVDWGLNENQAMQICNGAAIKLSSILAEKRSEIEKLPYGDLAGADVIERDDVISILSE